MSIEQSNVIFGALLFAFLIFITARGKLPIYMGFLLGYKPTATAARMADATANADPATGEGNILSSELFTTNKVASLFGSDWRLSELG